MANDSTLNWAANMMAAPLSDQEKALRDLFVSEYLKDYDSYRACLRLGFQPVFAEEYSRKLFHDPYVQSLISDSTRQAQIDSEEEVKRDRALIINTLRQASQVGPYSSRVSAVRELREMRGFVSDSSDDVESSIISAFKEFAQKAPA